MSGWYPAACWRRVRAHYFDGQQAWSLCGRRRRRSDDDQAGETLRHCAECRQRLEKRARETQPGRDRNGRLVKGHSVRSVVPRAVPLTLAPPVQPHAGKCPHGFTVTTRLHGAFACALCEEAAA